MTCRAAVSVKPTAQTLFQAVAARPDRTPVLVTGTVTRRQVLPFQCTVKALSLPPTWAA